jgi:UDP-glucose 4-epimerase
VYGNPKKLPITENSPIGDATNPYGSSKLMIENILNDIYKSDNQWKIGIFLQPESCASSNKIIAP